MLYCYMYSASSKLQISRLVVIITIITVCFYCMAFPIDNSPTFFYGSKSVGKAMHMFSTFSLIIK